MLVKGRSGSLTGEFNADYDAFDMVKVMEEQATAGQSAPTGSLWTSWKDLLEAC